MRKFKRFNPKTYELLTDYNKERFISDFGAGLTVSVVALPLAMAFAIASGLGPEAGIFTAIIAGFLISLFSGSRVQIGGPAGAFIVIIYGIVQQYGVDGLLIATLMSGVMLWAMGLLRMGVLIKFIPVAVIIGFTNGIAVLIALSQIKAFLGLSVPGEVPADFFNMLKTLWHALPTWKPAAVFIALFALTLIIIWQYVVQRFIRLSLAKGHTSRLKSSLLFIPGSMLALIIATLLCHLLGLEIETIGSKFGGIPQELPQFRLPEHGGWETLKNLFFPALTLAVLGAIESLLCARVADSVIRDKHDSNQELLAQGFANMVVPFFGGMPATGTIARTITSVKNGGNSPIAGMVHALGILVIVLLAAPLAKYIPLAALSAILLFVAWNMGEWREFVRLRSYKVSYRLVLLSVFLLTVVVDLTAAVQVGIFLSCLTFIYRISSLSVSEPFTFPQAINTSGIQGHRLSGALFFGAVKVIEAMQDNVAERALVLDFSAVIYIDSSGAEALDELQKRYQEQNIPILICGLRQQPEDLLLRTGWLQALNQAHIFSNREGLINYLPRLSAIEPA